MRSKTLISYQKGYCGQPADIEAMKPREARAYCLGVGHVAAGTLPLGCGAEVLAALSSRRRGEGDDETAAVTAATTATPSPQTRNGLTVGSVVKLVSLSGPKTLAYLHQSSKDLTFSREFVVTQVVGNTIHIRQKPSETLAIYGEFPSFGPLDAADFALVVKDSPRKRQLEPGDIVRRKSALGSLTNRPNVLSLIPEDKEVKVLHVDMSDSTIMVDTWRQQTGVWVNAEDFVLVRRATPEPPR